MREVWKILRQAAAAYVADDALSRGAAISFYAVTTVAPILFITVSIAGLVFGRDAARGALALELGRVMSHESAQLLQQAVRHASNFSGNVFANILGVVMLLVTASGVFGEMEAALNHIWGAKTNRPLVSRMLRGRLASLALVAGLGLLFLLSMAVTAVVTALRDTLSRDLLFGKDIFTAIDFAVSFVLIAILFAAIYKILPDKDLQWRDVIFGAMTTSLLFAAGQIVLGLYLASSSVASPYGAAGGVVVLLLWVYYTAQVFLFGAEMTKVYARLHGSQR